MLIDPSENKFYKRMCNTLNRDEDLPLFPIELELLVAVKTRVNLARSLDKLLLDSRKEEAEKTWLKRAAEEAELELSDEEDEGAPTSQEKAQLRNKIKSTRTQLNSLLATPMHNQRFLGKYPTMSGKLMLPSNEFRVDKAITAVNKSQADMKSLLGGSQSKRKKFKASNRKFNPKKKRKV